MWRSHMVIGASAWLGLQTLADPVTGTGLDWRERACGAVVAAGAALLCDLDTPSSRLANTLGPITRTAARLIGRVFGGHRHGTHSIAFCALTGALSTLTFATAQPVHITDTVTVSVGELAALAVVYLAAALSASALLRVPRRERRDDRPADHDRRRRGSPERGAAQRGGHDRLRITPARRPAHTRGHRAVVAAVTAARLPATHPAHR